eukprot:2815085-Rhodomonas_salina.2
MKEKGRLDPQVSHGPPKNETGEKTGENGQKSETREEIRPRGKRRGYDLSHGYHRYNRVQRMKRKEVENGLAAVSRRSTAGGRGK